MPAASRPWLANAWLLLLAAPLAGAALMPVEAFVAETEWLYLRLPIHAAVFRADLLVQTRILHRACGPLAVAALTAWVLASARGVKLASSATGERADEDTPSTWRRRLGAALLAYAMLLAPVRLLRDGLREGELAGMGFEERRLHVYGRHSLEPDYAALEAFRRRSGGEGAVLVLRSGRHFDFADVFAASYLFPQRVYVERTPDCTGADVTRAASARPDVRWLQLSCEPGPFAPRRLGRP